MFRSMRCTCSGGDGSQTRLGPEQPTLNTRCVRACAHSSFVAAPNSLGTTQAKPETPHVLEAIGQHRNMLTSVSEST